jgi:hypothetical protein
MKIGTVLRLMRQKCDELGSQAGFARQVEASQQYVSLVLQGKRPPTDGMLSGLGLERAEQEYRKVKR